MRFSAYEMGTAALVASMIGLFVFIALYDPEPLPSRRADDEGTTPPNVSEQPVQKTFFSENAALIGGLAGGVLFVIILLVLGYRYRTALGSWYRDKFGFREIEEVAELTDRQLKRNISILQTRVDKGIDGAQDDLDSHRQEYNRRNIVVDAAF